MTYTAVNSAVGKIILESKINLIDQLVEYLDKKIDIDDDMKNILHEFKSTIVSSKVTASDKKKRSPSLFNLYVKEKLPELKAAHPDIRDGKLMISMASEAWKADPFALYIKTHAADMKKDDTDIDNKTLYDKLKTMFLEQEHQQDIDTSKKTKKSTKKIVVTSDDDVKDIKVTKKGKKANA
jgi:hypothetical protein